MNRLKILATTLAFSTLGLSGLIGYLIFSGELETEDKPTIEIKYCIEIKDKNNPYTKASYLFVQDEVIVNGATYIKYSVESNKKADYSEKLYEDNDLYRRVPCNHRGELYYEVQK